MTFNKTMLLGRIEEINDTIIQLHKKFIQDNVLARTFSTQKICNKEISANKTIQNNVSFTRNNDGVLLSRSFEVTWIMY